MPAFLVELPAHPGHTLKAGANKMTVFAVDAASAIDAAQAEFDGDSNAMWNGATATQILAGTDLAGYELSIAVLDSSPVIEVAAQGGAGNDAMASAVPDTQGATYSDDDIATVVGGTFTRAATFRVTGETGGAVDTVEVVDPGEYTVLPGLSGVATTGGGDGNLTLDLTAAGEDSYEVLMGQIVGLLNATSIIANAAVDMSEGASGTRLLTIASGGGGDDLGDKAVQAQLRKNESPVAGLLSTVTDEGASNAVLSVAIPATASLVLPSVTPVKGA